MPFHFTNRQIALARATVDVTAGTFHPATAQNAWQILKQARGQTVAFDHLTAAHIVKPATEPEAPISFAEMMDARRARIARRVQARIGQPTLGGAE